MTLNKLYGGIMNKFNDYETIELLTNRLKLMKGKEKDFLKVYEFDFSKLSDVDNVFTFSKSDNDKIKKCFKKGSKSYYKTCEKAHMFDWIMFLEDEAIGNILTTNENEEDKTICVEFNVHPNYWNKGYVTEAMVEVINYLFKIGYDNIRCSYVDGNEKAKRVLNKLGFKPFGIDKDSYKSIKGNLFDIYNLNLDKEDWLSRTSKIKL